ncbi:hypothetical protein ACFX2A_014469 [Malus domestica]
MTMTDKIFTRASEITQLSSGENVPVDVLMTNDVCGSGSIGIFKKKFGQNARVWNREKFVVIQDHYIFTINERANRNVDILRDFCTEQKIKSREVLLGFVLSTGKLLLRVPPTLRFMMDGEMPDYLLAKDLVMQIISEISVAGGAYKAKKFVQYC